MTLSTFKLYSVLIVCGSLTDQAASMTPRLRTLRIVAGKHTPQWSSRCWYSKRSSCCITFGRIETRPSGMCGASVRKLLCSCRSEEVTTIFFAASVTSSKLIALLFKVILFKMESLFLQKYCLNSICSSNFLSNIKAVFKNSGFEKNLGP